MLLILVKFSILGLVFSCSSLIDLLVLLLLNLATEAVNVQDESLVLLVSVYQQPRYAYTSHVSIQNIFEGWSS